MQKGNSLRAVWAFDIAAMAGISGISSIFERLEGRVVVGSAIVAKSRRLGQDGCDEQRMRLA